MLEGISQLLSREENALNLNDIGSDPDATRTNEIEKPTRRGEKALVRRTGQCGGSAEGDDEHGR